MKNRRLIYTLTLIAALAVAILAQTQRTPPNPLPPAASAQICGNLVISAAAKTPVFETLQADGCAVTHFVDLGDGYWLAYGVKVVIEIP